MWTRIVQIVFFSGVSLATYLAVRVLIQDWREQQ